MSSGRNTSTASPFRSAGHMTSTSSQRTGTRSGADPLGEENRVANDRRLIDPGMRRGVHFSHVATPYVYALSTVEQRRALGRFERYHPFEPIVWRKAGRGLYWTTQKFASLEDELLRMARRRERGLRQSLATLARWTGSTADLVARVLRSLVSRGIGTLLVERGRYGRSTFRLVGIQSRSLKGIKDAALNSSERRWLSYSEEERAKLEADAYAWRVGLQRSLEAVGCSTEREYLELVAE
jgi:hypothetical protein